MSNKKITIGKFGAPHGVRGEMRVVPLTDFPDRFETLKQVFLEDNTVLEIEQVKYNKQFVILKFKNYIDRAMVESLKGKYLQVNREDVPPLAPGEYYSFDIIGLKVYDDKGAYLGSIKEILKTGSNDVYVVQNEKNEVLVPALKKVVTDINLETGTMHVILLEEMSE